MPPLTLITCLRDTDLHDINASASVPRHRNRRHPARASAQCSASSENIPVQHIRTFTGHRNSRTIIKECAFYGDRFVLSGSDCGHLFMWDKESGDHVGIFLADQHVVNCVQPHATYPIVATSGIDHNIKIWIPSSKSETEETAVYLDNRKSEWKKILERNEEMLRESQNTLTVLDPLLLGLLASISRARLNRDTSSPSRPDSSTSGGQ
ncbi:hypothetical protein GJ496_009396 [Pomphorhynchus laevis]|nr:hypothetical protein GJ496_009396 [Pomphorhynchus laevis]